MAVVMCGLTLDHEERVDFLEAQVCGFWVVKVDDLHYSGYIRQLRLDSAGVCGRL